MRAFFTALFVVLFTTIRWFAKGVAFIATHGINLISDKQSVAGTTQKSAAKQQPVASALPSRAVVVSSTLAAASAVADPLVLRTGMESINQEMLKQRPVLPVSGRTIVLDLVAQTKLPIAKAWIYLYADLKIAKRVLKIQDKHLARIVCGEGEDRYFFKEVEYLVDKGTKDISDQFLKEIQQLLNRKKATQQAAPVVVQTKPAPPAQVVVPVPQKPAQQPVAEPVRAPNATLGHPRPDVDQRPPNGPVNRSVKGAKHQGYVVAAQKTQKNGPNGPYSTFCLTLNDGSREIPFNGTEVERLCREMGIRVGDKIQVVDMGRMEPAFAGQWTKNLYQITPLGAN